MGYNKKEAQVSYEHQDKSLDKQRAEKGHNEEKSGSYERILREKRKNSDQLSIHEKQLEKHHKEGKQSPKITEKWFEDEDKRDASAHSTNTLPINELAEEAQRRRIEMRGDGDGFVEDHFQNYKKKDSGLSKENYAKLSGAVNKMDKLWMASSWGRLTTSEKKTITDLKTEINEILNQQLGI